MFFCLGHFSQISVTLHALVPGVSRFSRIADVGELSLRSMSILSSRKAPQIEEVPFISQWH